MEEPCDRLPPLHHSYTSDTMPERIAHVCHHGETISDCHRSWQKRLKSSQGLQEKRNSKVDHNSNKKPTDKLLLKSDLEAHKCHSRSLSSTKNSSNVSSSKNHYSHFSQNVSHFLVLVLTLLTFAHCADGCSSRSTPKPRPPSHTSIARPNITFQTYACPPAYSAWYCLNGATCFTVKIADSILYNCECADGYMGQRCEFKDLDGTYLPTREKLLMGMGLVTGKTSKVGPVFLAVLILIVVAAVVSFIVTRTRTRAKRARLQQQQSSSDTISHIDCGSGYSTPSSSPNNVHGTYSRGVSNMGYTTRDLSVLGQSISYSLSQQRYPYLAECQGVELRSIHHRQYPNTDNPSNNRMYSSRIPSGNSVNSKHLVYST